MEHGAEHDRILERVLFGELPADAREVRQLAQDCVSCAERLAADAEIARELAAAGDEVTELLAVAGSLVPGEEAALATFRARVRGAPRAGFRTAPVLLLAAAGAIAATLLFMLLLGRPQRGDDGGSRLAPGALECTNLDGAAGNELVFRWRHDGGPGTRYVLRVFDEREDLLFEARDLDDRSYVPGAEERIGLHGSLRWEVVAFDSSGAIVASDEARATIGP